MVTFIKYAVHKEINIRLENLNDLILKKKRIGIQAKLHALFVDMKIVIVGNMIPMKENVNVDIAVQL